MIYAFIFARGGSKGLPGKNIKLFNGVPLIVHTIRQAKENPLIASVAVSTDSKEITDIAADAGATVIQRPFHLASDDSLEWDSWRHAVDTCYMDDNDIMLSLPATSPLRKQEDITACIKEMGDENIDAAITVHPSIGVRFDNRNEWVRRQCRKSYDIAGSVYAVRAKFIRTAPGLASAVVAPVVVARNIDIDTIDDFEAAERFAATHYYRWAI